MAPVEIPLEVEHARPFVKWVGGKRKLVSEIQKAFPRQFGAYHEPFVGGGAVFFALSPARAILSDANARLVRAYCGVRDSVDWVVELLRRYPHDRGFFHEMRAKDIDAHPDAEVAAWFIYLNKTAYNGLYRVNSRNEFNVPFGDYANPNFCDEENLRACSRALHGARVVHDDFESVEDRAKPGDLVYFDPPYVPLSVTSSFTSYTATGFGMNDQRRLRDLALRLKTRGVHVVVSNSSAGAVRELYREGFRLRTIRAPRAVSCKGDRRHAVDELVIF